MAYRRRQQVVQLSRPPISVGEEEPVRNPHRSVPLSRDEVDDDVVGGSKDVPVSLHSSDSSSSSSLAAKAMRASSAHRDSSHSSAYASQPASRFSNSNPASSHSYTSSFPPSQDSTPVEYTSMKNLNESKHGFWGALARKAKSIIDDDDGGQPSATFARTRDQVPSSAGTGREKFSNRGDSDERNQKVEGSTLQKGLGAIASSLNYLGGTIGNAFEESITIVENKTADIIQETRKHIRKKPSGSVEQNHALNRGNAMHQHLESGQELQLKASRDVAMAMAAKAKLLLRELKTVKADLAFAKERCAQLEDENKILRENRERGDSLDDDDLVRLQLETLLAEKARLAHENAVYARENRFLQEIVEYHQLTMQDVVYFDEGTEEVTEVYPIKVTSAANNLHSISAEVNQSLAFTQPPQAGLDTSSQMTRIIPTRPVQPSELRGISRTYS